jgi:hypothetical protein
MTAFASAYDLLNAGGLLPATERAEIEAWMARAISRIRNINRD